ncbi:MAG: TetR/AcrR family transcriptional regulator [Bacteroidetes bacterium]|nr:TetR/AcrR family transcriptional regulator [Bacteroidota bacterium]
MTELSPRQLEILEKAGKLLSTSGVGSLTIKNLAKEIGFSESAIYRHFASKESIILHMLEYLSNDMDLRLGGAILPEDGPETKYRKLLINQFGFFKQHPHFVMAVFSDGLLEAQGEVNKAYQKLIGTKTKHLLPVIENGQMEGVFTNSIGANELLHITMGAFRLQMFKWRISQFRFDLMVEGSRLVDDLLRLISLQKA